MEMQLLIAFSIYFGILFAIGLLSRLKTKTSADFMLGSRGINYWVTAIAAHASDMSAWLFMAFPAAIYTHGLVGAWIAVGLIGGMFLSWHFIAYKLRIATEQYNVVTLSSYFEKRFADTSELLRLASSLVCMFFFIFYIAAGLTGMGRVFESVFCINYHSGMAIGLIGSLVYIIIGGFIAIAWNHFFQGIFLLIMLMLVPFYALINIGGFNAIVSAAQAQQIPLSFIPSLSTKAIIEIINGIVWGVGYLGMPHIIINYMAIDNPKNITKSKYLGMAWLITSLTCSALVGLIGIGYFSTMLANSELVFVELVKDMFNPLLAGFILCAIIAATMSTIDTQILVTSNAITHDFYKKMISSRVSDKELMWVSRLSIIAIALMSYIIALPNSSTVMGLVSYAWSGLASAFSPVIVAALYGTKTTRWGALAGIIVGAFVSGLWPLVDTMMLPLIPGCIASIISIWFISRITR